MAVKTVVAGSTVSASQLKDLFRQVEDGSIGGRQMQAFLEHRNPWGASTGFTVTSDGRSCTEFIKSLGARGIRVWPRAEDVLNSPAFVSTSRKTYKLVVLNGEEFEDADRITSKIRAEAKRCGYLTPPAEVAPLLREMLSDKVMKSMGNTHLMVMHEPIADSNDNLSVLGASWVLGSGLLAHDCNAHTNWSRGDGFVFLAAQE